MRVTDRAMAVPLYEAFVRRRFIAPDALEPGLVPEMALALEGDASGGVAAVAVGEQVEEGQVRVYAHNAAIMYGSGSTTALSYP